MWRTYMKLTKCLTRPRMKEGRTNYVKSCQECEMYKVQYKQPTDQVVLPEHPKTLFKVVQLDYLKVKKRHKGVKMTRSFLLGVDECTCMVTARAGKEDANTMNFLLSIEVYCHMKTIISDSGPAFSSRKLKG